MSKWPRGAAVAWDEYLREYVEVCEYDEELDVVTCRRFWPAPTGNEANGDEDGMMMPLPVSYFVPATTLAAELMQGWCR